MFFIDLVTDKQYLKIDYRRRSVAHLALVEDSTKQYMSTHNVVSVTKKLSISGEVNLFHSKDESTLISARFKL